MTINFLLFLPLLAALLPAVAVHISLALAINAEAIPACIPYFEGCASISATGRYAPASYVFKPAFMTQWVLLCLYWGLNARWLQLMADHRADMPKGRLPMMWLGYAAAVSLVVYVTFLGTNEPFYEFMRRFGIYGYFLGTVLAQIWLALATIRIGRARGIAVCRTIGRAQLYLALCPFALGVLNLILKALLPDEQAGRYENIIEWLVAALMQAGLALTFWSWRASRFRLAITTG